MPSSYVCVDASLVVGLLTHSRRDRLRELWATWDRQSLQITAPSLLRYEATNALHQYGRAGYLQPISVDRFLNLIRALPIDFVDDPELSRRSLLLARRHGLAATYDSHYLALADYLGAPLWTLDRKLVAKVGEELDWVRLAVDEP